MVNLRLVINDNEKKVYNEKDIEGKEYRPYICPITGISFEKRNPFWKYAKPLLKPKNMKNYDISINVENVENEENLKNLFHKCDIEYLWIHYFKEKEIVAGEIEGLIGLIDLEVLILLVKIWRKEEKIEDYINGNVGEEAPVEEEDPVKEEEPLEEAPVEEDNYIPSIMNGDVITKLKELSDKSVDTFITSPPYWGQRDYDNDDQWGNEESIEMYLNKMIEWANECKRVLTDEGTLFLNIGDKYGKKSLNMIPERLCIKMIDNGWVLRNKIIWYKPNHQPSGVKDRFTNTWEYIYFFNKDSGKYFNYKYYQNIDCLRIEHKGEQTSNSEFPNTLTVDEYEKGNYENKINEYNKKKNYKGKYQDQESINIGGSAGGRKSKGISYSKQRITEITPRMKREIHEYIISYYKDWKVNNKGVKIDKLLGYKSKSGHWFRTDPGGSLPKVEDWNKLKDIIKFDDKYDKIMTEEHYVLQSVKNNPKGKNPGDIWEIKLEHSSEKHFAAFPLELPTRLIRAFCPPDGVVCDPFGGSGTTGVSAMREKRKSIMIELNPDFCEIMKKRFNQVL